MLSVLSHYEDLNDLAEIRSMELEHRVGTYGVYDVNIAFPASIRI